MRSDASNLTNVNLVWSSLLLSVTASLLLRKDVIHPHLPVRIPCYDFIPITNPTFDGSLSCELSHRLRVLPTFVV